MKRPAKFIVPAIGVVGACLLVPVSSASASSPNPQSKHVDSAYAGYDTTVEAASVQADVTLPAFTCKGKDSVSAFDDTQNENTSQYEGALVYLECGKKNAAEYEAGLDVEGTFTYPSLTMRAGDTVQLSISCGSGGTVVTVDDLTSSMSQAGSSSVPSTCNGAFIGMSGIAASKPGKYEPLPTFGNADFSGAVVNSDPIGDLSPTVSNYYEGKKDVINTGALAGGGSSFSDAQAS